jgi:hypothetical protein
MHVRINSIRIDCAPLPHNKVGDLCLGSCTKAFKIDNSGYIRSYDYTIKYTRRLFLNFYIKKNFIKTLRRLPRIIENVRTQFNQFKKTKVRSFKIKLVNIQASGYLSKRIDLRNINTDIRKTFNIEIGRHIEPSVPITFTEQIPAGLTYLSIISQTSKLKVYHNGCITIVASNCEHFLTLVNLLDKIQNEDQRTNCEDS